MIKTRVRLFGTNLSNSLSISARGTGSGRILVTNALASSLVNPHRTFAFLLYLPDLRRSAKSAGMRDLSTVGRKTIPERTLWFSVILRNIDTALTCAAVIWSVVLFCAQARSEVVQLRFCITSFERLLLNLGLENGLNLPSW